MVNASTTVFAAFDSENSKQIPSTSLSAFSLPFLHIPPLAPVTFISSIDRSPYTQSPKPTAQHTRPQISCSHFVHRLPANMAAPSSGACGSARCIAHMTASTSQPTGWGVPRGYRRECPLLRLRGGSNSVARRRRRTRPPHRLALCLLRHSPSRPPQLQDKAAARIAPIPMRTPHRLLSTAAA
jgi:hypothetical protein